MNRFILIAIPVFVIACSDQERETARLATGCINASPDNRVKLSGSWSNSFDVEVLGDDITVRTEVPLGIAMSGKIKLGRREFRCRKVGGRIEFISAVWEQPS
ncbi:MAG: hypothetical protein OER43_02260 [Gammaproteobacteria bacterium]|nr:hypothetical protein [Gammaproteobacteria bacterium]MDH3412459.1 hypothetical protein [Gammaproteobacteria bacterium]